MKTDIFKIKKENQELRERVKQLESELDIYKRTFKNITNIFNKQDKESQKTHLEVVK